MRLKGKITKVPEPIIEEESESSKIQEQESKIAAKIRFDKVPMIPTIPSPAPLPQKSIATLNYNQIMGLGQKSSNFVG